MRALVSRLFGESAAGSVRRNAAAAAFGVCGLDPVRTTVLVVSDAPRRARPWHPVADRCAGGAGFARSAVLHAAARSGRNRATVRGLVRLAAVARSVARVLARVRPAVDKELIVYRGAAAARAAGAEARRRSCQREPSGTSDTSDSEPRRHSAARAATRRSRSSRRCFSVTAIKSRSAHAVLTRPRS